MSPKPTPSKTGQPEPAAPASSMPRARQRPSSRVEADERIKDVEPRGSGDSEPRHVAPSRFSLILVAILTGTALFMGGFSLGAYVATTPGTPADEEARFAPFWDVYSLIQRDYAGSPKPNQDQLVQAAIKGMMESLNDPWSYYQAPADFQNSLLDVGGQAEGIGVIVKLQPIDPTSDVSCASIGNGCELAVDRPIPNSPAEAAGIQPGDVVVSVNDVSLNGMTIDQAAALIRGPRDTTVKLGLLRDDRSITLSIVRQLYSQPEVDTKTLAAGAVAYIHVAGINDPAASQFHGALAAALAAGQRDVVLDLRGNLGGYVSDAVRIASEFISSGVIAYQEDAHGKVSEVRASSGGIATDPSIRVVVLVDGNTASAAEILAGALQAHGRAVLIGTATYGKGVVQEWLPLSNNFGGIHLTAARWLTPDRVWIQGKGLQPDVPVNSDNARAGTDPVLDTGLQHLGYAPQATASPSPAPSPSTSTTAGPGSSAGVSPTASPTPTPSSTPTPAPTPTPTPSPGATQAPAAPAQSGGPIDPGQALPLILVGTAAVAGFVTMRRYKLVRR